VSIAPAVDFRNLEQVLVITEVPEQPGATQSASKG
jgi:hypothetical protein